MRSSLCRKSHMVDDVTKKIGASIFLLILSWIVLYQSCRRASTIYFFELDSTTVIFMERIHAVIFPLILSILLYFVYLGTKRSSEVQKERVLAAERLKSSSALNSRKASREMSRKPSVSLGPDEVAETQLRIKRLLSDIEEAEIENTIRSQQKYLEQSDLLSEKSEPAPSTGRFTVQSADDKIVQPPETSSPNRASPTQHLYSVSQRSSRSSSFNEKNKMVWTTEETPATQDVYKTFGDLDLFSYSLSVMSLFPGSDESPRVFVKLDFLDLISELFAIHLPIWACVACIHIILLESFSQHFSFHFYYHEESMMYASLLVSILFGVFHELYGNWISNDILAFSSIYVTCSRIQAVSYQTAFIFVIGMSVFDLFFLYVVDLLSTVTKHNRAPLMIIIPRDRDGHTQSLATLDIMVPGIFLNVLLKYSSMFDSSLFIITFSAVFASLVFTMLFAIWRAKTTPAMVFPAVSAIIVSLACASHVDDLWKFMIKH